MTDRDKITAEIAGRICAALATKPDANLSGMYGADGVASWMKSVVLLSTGLAMKIIAELNGE